MYMFFGENLRKLRIIRGLTQRQLADRTGICMQSILAYENGKRQPSLETAVIIAEFFDASLDRMCRGNLEVR